jgi:hypothetical protein
VGRRAVHTRRYSKQVPGHHIQVDVTFLWLKDAQGRKVRRFQYTAIDDATRIRALKVYERHTQKSAIDFAESYHEEALKLIELAQVAHRQYLAANPAKQAKILKCVASNLVFDGATVSATYRKPFDVLAERPSSENWLPG